MSESLPHDLPPLITGYRRRKTIGTVLAIVVLVSTLATVWYFFVRAPSPKSVCDHMHALQRQFPQHGDRMRGAVSSLAVRDAPNPVHHSADQQCTWYFTTEQKQRSFFDYGKLARCVTFADTPQALYPCLQ